MEYEFISQGSIPAWAGETYAPYLSDAKAAVYPRVGGGNHSRYIMPTGARGLSPRGRGKRAEPWFWTGLLRSIPAWAGETGFL